MCFTDDHASVATQLGNQLSESPHLLWCFLLGWDLFCPGGFHGDWRGRHLKSQICALFIAQFLIALTLETRTATVSAGWVEAALIGTAYTDVLAAIVAVETLLLCDARTLRTNSSPLPLLFLWHSDTPSQVPETKTHHIQVIFYVNRLIDPLYDRWVMCTCTLPLKESVRPRAGWWFCCTLLRLICTILDFKSFFNQLYMDQKLPDKQRGAVIISWQHLNFIGYWCSIESRSM